MFLVNSRAVLVTAIYVRILISNTYIDIPYTEDTGLDCRIPLTNLSLTGLSLLS